MSDLVILIVKDLSGVIDYPIIQLINARNAKNKGFVPMVRGDSYQKLRSLYEGSPQNGNGYDKVKEGVKYYVLPFRSHPEMTQPKKEIAQVLSRAEFLVFSWDIEED